MPREDELDLKVRNCFDELFKRISELKGELECLEGRVSKLEKNEKSTSSSIQSFQLDSGEIRADSE